MKRPRWLHDTLAKRLFVLMWVALVGSHLAAYLLVTGHVLPPPPRPGPNSMPTLPSLPPTPGFSTPRDDRQPPPRPLGPGPGPAPGLHGEPPDAREVPPVAPGGEGRGEAGPPSVRSLRADPPPPAPTNHSGGLPPFALVVDYGVRLFLIALAAWWGARWLARPVRRLVDAAAALGASLGRTSGAAAPRLDETEGTHEVREAARVFNRMAAQLDEQFRSRELLMAALSHDLRTPLTRLRLRLEALSDRPEAQRGIADIHEMDSLVESALEVFRNAEAAEPAQATDLFALAQSVTDDFAEHGQRASLAGAPLVAKVQPLALRRVLANLVGNAIRYGGGAEVSVQAVEGGALLRVEDRGPGIPPHQLDAVCLPFYRVDASRSRATGGTGLGLYIARDLTLRQGGRLTLVNREGGGLRAEVWLPMG